MASFREDIAQASRRTGILIGRLPEKRDELITAYAQMLDDVETASTAKEAEAALLSYSEGVEAHLR